MLARLERITVIHRLLIFGFVWLLSCEIASAEVLKKGQSIRDAINAMKVGGYESTVLEMRPRGKDQDIHFWGVDEGILIVEYSKTTDEIVSLRFLLQDDRPKKYRQQYIFDVIAFDTDTGEMKIRTKNNKPAGRSDHPAEQRRTKP